MFKRHADDRSGAAMRSRVPWGVAVRIACVAAAAAGQLALWKATRTVDTAKSATARMLRVASGQQLALELPPPPADQPQGAPQQPIVDYQTPRGHSHRVRIYMQRGRLSDLTRAAFNHAGLPAPKGNGVLEIGPDPKYERSSGPECQVSLLAGFANNGTSVDRSLLLYPAQSGESGDAESVRTVHLQSASELLLRFSTNSADGQRGPRCRSVLTMRQDDQSWSSPLGMDWEWSFVAAPDFDIRITFAPDLWTGQGEVGFGKELESLALEKIEPQRLRILPVGGNRAIRSRERRGTPAMAASSLRLGPDFLDVGLEGKVGIPVRESLAGWQWATAFGTVDLALLAWLASGLRRRDRIFLSYSRQDEGRVMEIYNFLQEAGGKPWIDRENIPGGARWRALIERQMHRSRYVLVFLSEHSVTTGGYFWMEMEIAVSLAERRRQQAFLIPVKLEECRVPEVLTPYNILSLHEDRGRERLLPALGLLARPGRVREDPARAQAGPARD